MLNAISLVIEQRKNEFDRIAQVWFFPHHFLYLARVISLIGHQPGSIFSHEGDIASTQNLFISFKPIIFKLCYSHVIMDIIECKDQSQNVQIINKAVVPPLQATPLIRNDFSSTSRQATHCRRPLFHCRRGSLIRWGLPQ